MTKEMFWLIIGHSIGYALLSYGPGAFFYIPIYFFCVFALDYDFLIWLDEAFIFKSNTNLFVSCIIFLASCNIICVSNYIAQIDKLANNQDSDINESMINTIKRSAIPCIIFAIIAYGLWIGILVIYKNIFDILSLDITSIFSLILLYYINCYICCFYYHKFSRPP